MDYIVHNNNLKVLPYKHAPLSVKWFTLLRCCSFMLYVNFAIGLRILDPLHPGPITWCSLKSPSTRQSTMALHPRMLVEAL